jgi:hypothetical protein
MLPNSSGNHDPKHLVIEEPGDYISCRFPLKGEPGA